MPSFPAAHRNIAHIAKLIALVLLTASPQPLLAQHQKTQIITLARKHFGADAPWYLHNIPFLEIDDPEIEAVYYYRWQVYRSHIREIGPQGTMVTEFLPEVNWGRKPWTDLNDSSSFHLMEGRWLRNPAVINSLIDHLYAGGGNDRHFSESVAAASLAATNVTGDQAVLQRNFDIMRQTYTAWDDHFDATRNLYWIEPIADATEYTISSIDASGAGFETHPDTDPAKNGFLLGDAYRPSINTYQYGNALAIAQIADRLGKPDVAADFRAKAARLQSATLSQLWWSVTLPHKRVIRSVEAYFLDDATFHAPTSFHLQYKRNGIWLDIPAQTRTPASPLANGRNQISFAPIETDGLRLLLPASPAGTQLRLIELEAFEQPRP
jgi:hypothetical protein